VAGTAAGTSTVLEDDDGGGGCRHPEQQLAEPDEADADDLAGEQVPRPDAADQQLHDPAAACAAVSPSAAAR
jgi:hypothetical protein